MFESAAMLIHLGTLDASGSSRHSPAPVVTPSFFCSDDFSFG